jgi:hypothetical protein
MNKGTKIKEKHLFQRYGINRNTVRHEEKKVLIERGNILTISGGEGGAREGEQGAGTRYDFRKRLHPAWFLTSVPRRGGEA